MTFESIDLTPRIGTEIKTNRDVLLSGSESEKIRALLEQRGALVFRGLHFTAEEQLAFTATLGEVLRIIEGVYKVTVDEAESEWADLNRGAVCWHFDGNTDDVPSLAGLLSPRRLSETGGQTEFANTYAAYDDLLDQEKKQFDKLRVIHCQETLQRTVFPDPTEKQLARWRRTPPKSHPLVWTHRSGRKSLVLGATATSVEGMSPAEGRALIERLQSCITQPQYVYRHEWKMGDLIIWNNTGVQHRVLPFPLDSGRMLHRTTLKGEEPLV